MEIRRFGPGHRSPEGPPGTQGVTGQVIHHDERGLIAELAFSANAMIPPHANPNTTFFVVVSGGGWVQVAEERARVGHGEAVVWPAGELHGAWTDGTEMRELIVEFTGDAGPQALPGTGFERLEGRGEAEGPDVAEAGGATPGDSAGGRREAEPGRGSLADEAAPRDRPDETAGEPW